MKINLIEYFQETVLKEYSRTAVIDGDRNITYCDLDKKARAVARTITAECGCLNSPVAIYLPKGIESVYCDIAVTYSGNAYMNLDIKNPLERIGNILSLIKPRAVITDNAHAGRISGILPSEIKLINIDGIQYEDIPDASFFMERLSALIDTDPYCIINTSGSTGTPKGVVLNHRSFIDFMSQTFDEYGFTCDDVIGSLSPLVFDIYSYELCIMMAKGATMAVIPDTYSAFPVRILELMARHKVTYIFWVPTIMVNIANMGLLDKVKLPELRLVWFAGEVFPTKQFNIWRRSLPHTGFANFYGPIEITLDCVYYNVERELADNEPIPIGKAFRNTDILILDEADNRITEPGRDGELCVRGTSLAMGYYNNPEKTAAAFVQNPLNRSYPETIYRTGDIVFINERGEIVFKGRKDTLIKHMGYRIELGEIEHVIINTLKLVRNGCVVYNHQKKEIILFYESENDIAPADFRKAIGTALPKYMIPVVYTRLEELRRNTNGKIDRLYYNNLANEKN